VSTFTGLCLVNIFEARTRPSFETILALDVTSATESLAAAI
jgi:hypothetical protein